MIGIGAAIENIIPPVPADTFVLLGAFLASSGAAQLWIVFVCTLVPNVATALLTYALARRYGKSFFQGGIGRRLINERQLEQIGGFYRRWGTPAIFVSRFLPAFRAVVPIFAGVTHVSVPKLMVPLVLASALWYGALIYLGGYIGRNWEEITALFGRLSTGLLVVAAVFIAAFAWWWIRTRRHAS